MLAVLISIGFSSAWADEDPAETTETPAEESPAADEGWEDVEAPEDAIEDAIEGGAEEAVEGASAEPAEDETPAAPEKPELGYHQGFTAGQSDAKMASDYALHGLAGFGAGCLVGPCGCVAVPAIEAVVVPGVPAGPWQGYGGEYQQGYTEGYRRGVQRRRVVYSLVGASVGTVIGVGTGLAFGAFVS